MESSRNAPDVFVNPDEVVVLGARRAECGALDEFAPEDSADRTDDIDTRLTPPQPTAPAPAAPAPPWRRAAFAPDSLHPRKVSDERKTARELLPPPLSAYPRNEPRLHLLTLVATLVISTLAGFFLSANLAGLRGAVKTVSRTEPPRAAADTRQAAVTADVNGDWTLTNRVEGSNVASFRNVNLVYRLYLTQSGNRVTGSGHKWMENGRSLSVRSRTPIWFDGTLADGRLQLTFTEQGLRGVSNGTLVLDRSSDGLLRGRFSSEATRSQGSAQLTRVTSQ